MIKKKIIWGGFFSIALLAGTVTTVYASQGWQGLRGNLSEEAKAQLEEKRTAMQEKQTEMQKIFTDKDYNAWESLMQEKVELIQQRANELSAKINQDTFEKMSNVHELMAEGNYEEARELRKELGKLGCGIDMGWGRRGMRGGMKSKRLTP